VVLVDAVARAVPELGVTDAAVTVECPAELRCHVDRDHLHRMLLNYLTNAVKYGGGEVTLVASTARTGGVDGIEIRVHDNGSGVPPAFVGQLFHTFARGEGAAAVPGSGLGLAIVQGLAAANGGRAWYEPRAGRGSTFALWLPAAPTE
jgi:signal transduction histidine kinase